MLRSVAHLRVKMLENADSSDSSGVEEAMDESGNGCSSVSSQYNDLNLSRLGLDAIPDHYLHVNSTFSPSWVKSMALDHNQIAQLPNTLSQFRNLVALDVSNNNMVELPEGLCRLRHLRVLLLKNNLLDCTSFPKVFCHLERLEILNLSGNQLEEVPSPVFDLPKLKALYCGGNQIESLPGKIGEMVTLELLYLGGNVLREIPATIGKLKRLNSLVLCDNRLETIPSAIAQLQCLESLSLHNNKIKVLPMEIITIASLQQLSLRSNPLVNRFVRDMTFDPPSLKELAARIVKIKNLPSGADILPRTVVEYLTSAHQCVNPKCKGVYFDARVEHVKFSDFCGKFRVPLMQYLCSPVCSTTPAYAITDSSSEQDADDESPPSSSKMRKVLLG